MSWSFPGMDDATKCRERVQRSKERAATKTDPEKREHWQRVADAWHRAAEAAARTPPLIWLDLLLVRDCRDLQLSARGCCGGGGVVPESIVGSGPAA
jgi:hypothetical protein